ncbi:MAG TPA: hypothetical protein V6D14_29960 [Coleofasciculaceae cyanobacterium]
MVGESPVLKRSRVSHLHRKLGNPSQAAHKRTISRSAIAALNF